MNQFRHHQPRGGHRGDRSSGPPGPRSIEGLWPGYLKEGYFDGGHLRVEFVTRERVEPLVQAMANGQPALTTSQLRRFFQHCRRVESRFRHDRAEWGKVRPAILFLDAAAQDAFGKPEPKIPELFFDFIRRNVAAVKGPDDFLEGFIPHFEALVGFGATHIKNR